MTRCIVSTRPDGYVSVTTPTLEIMAFLTLGGAPKGHFLGVNWDAQIEEMTNRRVPKDVAVRYVRGLQVGGYTDAEAYEILRDRDTPQEWTGKELWDASEVPIDRWFRNAWRRSQNGGPIYIDINRAKPIQFKHIRHAVQCENKRREDDLDLFDVPFECDLAAIREQIRLASDETELRHIWPRFS